MPKAYANPANLEARDDMATASLMAGMAFGNAGVGAVHGCPVDFLDISGAELARIVAHQPLDPRRERMQEIAEAMGVNITGLSAVDAADQAVDAMTRLCAAVEIPSGLRSFGVPEESIGAVTPYLRRAAQTIGPMVRFGT